MKTLVLLLALIFLTSTAGGTWAGTGEPQFRLERNDRVGFDIFVSYPDGEPRKCTVTVQVTWGIGSTKSGTQAYAYTQTVHNTGNGWARFDGASALDTTMLSDASIISRDCAA